MSLARPLAGALTLCLVAVQVIAAQSPSAFKQEIAGQFESSARKLVALAEAMPESTYGWSPGEGVASVARVYMHIARYNYMYPDQNMDMRSEVGSDHYDTWEEEVTEKEHVVRILSESMDHVRGVIRHMSDADMEARTRLYGRDVGKWAVLLQLVTHMNEHLGQSIAYARTNGVVPPWSR